VSGVVRMPVPSALFAISTCSACSRVMRLQRGHDVRATCECGKSSIENADGMTLRRGLAGPVTLVELRT
jgi:hypothetical protein